MKCSKEATDCPDGYYADTDAHGNNMCVTSKDILMQLVLMPQKWLKIQQENAKLHVQQVMPIEKVGAVLKFVQLVLQCLEVLITQPTNNV